MLFCHMPCHSLPLVVNYFSKHSNKPLGTPSKLIQILGGGNCLFQALSYAVTVRQIITLYSSASANGNEETAFSMCKVSFIDNDEATNLQ